eukprot:TRINITY_DN30438_c0_g1_i1.p1 TRINITY_DN30438_c0_g1~~TRINITY_DN30438_c0_g1_i1.p1  ORF type:complete len:428 (-),score=65.48 TRINITY_DN30438_c0_g1_i1:182-1465(-)
MELCTGGSLQDLLEDICKLESSEQRIRCAPRLQRHLQELVYAVSYLHRFSPPIVHRDLKPDNALFDSAEMDSSVKLIDFGLTALESKVQPRGRGAGENYARGTPVFMAPELFLKGEGEFTTHMDVWALGVIFCWMATALQLGSLQHPMLPAEDGIGFDVTHRDLFYAYKEKHHWNRELFVGQPDDAFTILDKILLHEPDDRPSAFELMNLQWVDAEDTQNAGLVRNRGMVANLKSYLSLGQFDRLILSLAAENASEQQIAHLRRTFRALDKDGNGMLTRDELLDGFRLHEVDIDPESFGELFDEIDVDGVGAISYHEWLAATISRSILRSEKNLTAAFRCLDVSCTGKISRDDLVQFVGQEEADQIFGGIGNAQIDFDRFCGLVGRIARRRSRILTNVSCSSFATSSWAMGTRAGCPTAQPRAEIFM